MLCRSLLIGLLLTLNPRTWLLEPETNTLKELLDSISVPGRILRHSLTFAATGNSKVSHPALINYFSKICSLLLPDTSRKMTRGERIGIAEGVSHGPNHKRSPVRVYCIPSGLLR